jgi:hypothetical protein
MSRGPEFGIRESGPNPESRTPKPEEVDRPGLDE